MKIFYFLSFLVLLHLGADAQMVNVSGQCLSGTIPLTYIGDIDGKPAYEGLGTVDGNDNVPVGLYWLTPDNVWVLAFNGQPYYQNSCNILNPPGTPNPSCPWTAISGYTCAGVDALSLTGAVILPVRWISFTATTAGNGVQLYWKTASEINNKGFEVQRSSNGSDWTTLGFVNGAGDYGYDSEYRFIDAAPLPGKNVYRLVQMDWDGRQEFSKMVLVQFFNPAYYTIGNNPGSGRYQLTIQAPAPVQLSILDMAGKKVLARNVGTGVHQLDISQYPAGVYLLRLQKDNEIITEKLIKQ